MVFVLLISNNNNLTARNNVIRDIFCNIHKILLYAIPLVVNVIKYAKHVKGHQLRIAHLAKQLFCWFLVLV